MTRSIPAVVPLSLLAAWLVCLPGIALSQSQRVPPQGNSPAPNPQAGPPVQQGQQFQNPQYQNPQFQGQPLQGQPPQETPVQSPPVQSPPVQGPPVQGPPVQGPPVQGPPVQGPRVQGDLNSPPIVAPFQLTPPQEQYLNDILRYWEFRSSQVERYRCRFTRLVYDPVFGPQDRFTPKSQSTGSLKYAAPDKGLFKIEKVAHYTPPKQPGGQPLYLERPDETGEHWVCDGVSVFEFNYEKQQLIQRELPPDMRGKAIADGPLPFLFGAKADKIRQRYWMRVITPPDVKGEYWLEAHPKLRGDAGQFKKIEVILDEKDYLPKAIQVFDPNYDERRNPSRTVFVFEAREVNWNEPLDVIKRWVQGEFYEPKPPTGWKKVVEPYMQVVPTPPQTAQQPNMRRQAPR